jgi:hypothetical protein
MRHPPELRALWLACILITALIAALVSGLLSWAGGMNPPTAVLAGAGAFSGSTLLMITVLRFTSAAE